MVENILLLVLAVSTIAAMAFILRWYFHKLSRIEEEHWAGMAGKTTPRWARFLTRKTEGEAVAGSDGGETGGA
ncbi:MAG: hypothetical protein HN919_18950 [Verrucomicrobia bacterium]|jgi:hypothetical protein|nr:hypothetical protein [Verrucomicrobiota bacterium]MBT7068383.1 hypothetical protein [Verrucomicrobiota bacterium]MBT7702341.1 hypothetical protein [Verrucomicrobiota bacterium]